jgi:hypothetical protein
MRRLLRLAASRLKFWVRDDVATGPKHDPRYGQSVSYVPCGSCGEGSLVYDETAGTTVCNACGAVDDGPAQ